MAEKEPMIVVKKITVVQAGGHGGSWKVAFADFMTAMMAFFLVMWLISQSTAVKKNVSDYFSTPSVIEYNFSNYGVELSLEKLFLDLLNEPLRFFEEFIRPADYTPNIMSMGSKKIATQFMAEKIGDNASKVEVTDTEIHIEIPTEVLFRHGSDIPSDKFIEVMENINGITTGLEEAVVYVDSNVYKQSFGGPQAQKAKNVAEKRLDIVSNKIEARLEHPTVDIFGKAAVLDGVGSGKFKASDGVFKFVIKQKENINGKISGRKFDQAFGKKEDSMNVYDNFVKQLSKKEKKSAKAPEND